MTWTTPRMAPFGDFDDVSRRRAFDRDSVLRRLDWPLLTAVIALLAIGCALVYAAKIHEGTSTSFLTKHLINIVIGSALGVGATLVSYEAMRAYAPFVYATGIIGLIAVLGIGVTHNSAKSWIRVGAGFEVQPSEFAKVGFIVMLATILGERREGESDDPASRRIMAGLVLALVPMGLIMLQPDLGTTMVFVFTMFAALLTAPVKMRWVAGVVASGVAVVVLAISLGMVSKYQIARLTTFANLSDPAIQQSDGFQIYQSQIAISLGGLSGQGLLHGQRTNAGYVPVRESDFIMTVAGEELGLAGSSAIVALLGVVVWRGFRIARRSKDRFGSLVAVGVVSWFGIQAFENIGMNIGIMPITGIPLPFLSYGGSSMFAILLAVGLLQNIHLRTEQKAS
ncbi:MAG: rod shape determining protein RodA [Actinomycetota bacterium]|nr:rod shape determining protein RodA [Actinomycetota bacterium]